MGAGDDFVQLWSLITVEGKDTNKVEARRARETKLYFLLITRTLVNLKITVWSCSDVQGVGAWLCGRSTHSIIRNRRHATKIVVEK